MNRNSLPFRIFSLGLCCVLTGVLICVLTSHVFQCQIYPPDSDEAIHLMGGLTPALDARAGHWVEIARHLYFQPWYPPLYSVLLAVVFAVCDPSLTIARLTSVGLWALSLPLIALVVRSLSEKREMMGEVVAILMGATAPVFILLAALCMEEGLASLFVLLFLLLYIRTLKVEEADQQRQKAAVWAGLTLGMVFLSRISTALFLAAAVFINEILEGWHRKSSRRLGMRMAALLGPMIVVALLWLAHPAKTVDFLAYLRVSVPYFSLFSRANLTYYSLALADMYVAARPLALWMFVSVMVSLRQWRHGAVRFFLLLIVVTLGSLMLKRQANPRFAILAGIAAFILTGYQAAHLVRSLRTSPRWRQGAVAGLVALTLLITVQSLYRRFVTIPFALQVNYETDPETNALYAWVAEHVPAGERRIALINGWDQCSGSALQWYLSTSERTLPASSEEVIVAQFDLEDPSDEAVTRFVQLLEQRGIRYILHLEGGPVSHAGAWWAYKAAVQDRASEVAQQTFTIRLWDERVMDHLARNQVVPVQIETIQTAQHYPISIRATLFVLSPGNESAPLEHDTLLEGLTTLSAGLYIPGGERLTAPDGTDAILLTTTQVEAQ